MKKLIKPLLIIGILAVVAILLMNKNDTSTAEKELSNFAIEDTGSITKIYMATKAPNEVTLTKHQHGWMVNGKHLVRTDAIKTLLKTIHDLEVKDYISRAKLNNVISNLASTGIKVELYNEDILLRVFYVGGSTPEVNGTYMQIENSTEPFVVHVPGHQGYLTPRFFISEEEWKSRVIFGFKPTDIKSVHLSYGEDSLNASFQIINENNVLTLLNDVGDQVGIVDTNKLVGYLTFFRNIQYERIIPSLSNDFKDSLISSRFAYQIEVVMRNGESSILTTFHMKSSDQDEEIYNRKYKYDPDRLYGLMNGSSDIFSVQYFVLGKLLIPWQTFLIR